MYYLLSLQKVRFSNDGDDLDADENCNNDGCDGGDDKDLNHEEAMMKKGHFAEQEEEKGSKK